MAEVVALGVVLDDTRDGVGGRVGALSAVPIRHVDRPVSAGDDVTRSIQEVVAPVTGHTRFAQLEQDLTGRAELDHAMPEASRLWRIFARALGVGDPDVAVTVYVDTMWKQQHARTEAGHDIALSVELQNGVQVRSGAAVGAAPFTHPDRRAVGGDVHRTRRTPGPSIGQCEVTLMGRVRVGQIVDSLA